MENFWTDIQSNIDGYYDNIIVLLPRLAMAAVVLTIGYITYRLIKQYLAIRLSPVVEDPIITKFIVRVVKVILFIIVTLISLNIIGLGNIATGLWGTAGVGAFIIGFAFKDIGEHLLAGFMLAFSRPFRNGDVIEVSGVKGKVVGLTMRNTHLKTFSGKDVYIPNGTVIKNVLTNDTIDGFIRQEFSINVNADADLDVVEWEILQVLTSLPGILQEEKAPAVWINGVNDGRIEVIVRYWHDTFDTTVDTGEVRKKAIQQVLAHLRENGIILTVPIVELKRIDG